MKTSAAAPAMRTLSIGELSRATRVNIETIRYYERIGMLAAPPRTEGGHRVYEMLHARNLTFIRRSRELGFTLEEIRVLRDLGGRSEAPCGDVRDIASKHLGDVRAKIRDLQKLETLLAQTIDRCKGGTAPDCPVLDILAPA